MAGNLKCRFCGREVKSTVHSKRLPEGFRVDYYLVWTGELTPIIMKDPRDDKKVTQFFKVDHLHPVIACSDCYAKDNVREEMEHEFKGVPEAEDVENETEQ